VIPARGNLILSSGYDLAIDRNRIDAFRFDVTAELHPADQGNVPIQPTGRGDDEAKMGIVLGAKPEISGFWAENKSVSRP